MKAHPCQHQRNQDAAIEQQVRAVMQRVGTHRVGAGLAHHAVLQHQQGHGQPQRQDNHADTQPRCADRLRMLEPFIGLERNQYRTAGDKQGLRHTRQRLCLAMPITMIVIGGAQGVMHRQQVQQRGHAVEQRVGQPGEHAHRAAEPPGDGLGHNQHTGHAHRGAGGQAQEPCVFGAAGHELSLRGRLQAQGRQLLHAALELDQAWVVQRQGAAGFFLDDALQLGVIDLAVGADGFVQFLGGDLGGLARFEVNGARGEVDTEGDQAGDHIKQQAEGIEYRDGRVDLAVDLATAVGVENRPTGGELAQQGDGEDTADDTGSDTHEKVS